MSFQKLSTQQFNLLNETQKEEYRSTLFTHLLIEGSHDHVDYLTSKFPVLGFLKTLQGR